jgi:AP2 domain
MSESGQTMALMIVRYKEIPLTQGKVSVVDEADYQWLSQWKWYARKHRNTYYAQRKTRHSEKPRNLMMHVAILGANGGDHIDGNGLNNRRSNLRPSTRHQNGWNRGKQKNNTSGFKGVSWYQSHQKWNAHIQAFGKIKHLGFFDSILEAAKAYDAGAIKYHGEFAKLNFPNVTDSRPNLERTAPQRTSLSSQTPPCAPD